MVGALKLPLKILLSEAAYSNLQHKYWKLKEWHPLRKIKNKTQKYIRLVIVYPFVYYRYSKADLNHNKVIFIEPKYEKLSDNFYILYDSLHNQYNFDIHIHYLREFFCSPKQLHQNCLELIKDIATAKYIFMDEASNVMGRIHFRKGTQIIQLWHACGAFKKFGFSTAELIWGSTRKEMERYPTYRYNTMVTVSSPEIIWAYAEAMGIDSSRILPIGVSRTDVFFKKDFLESAKKKLELYMPASKGRKVILFAPTFRGRVAKAATATEFSIPQFYEALSDEYVLIFKHHPLVKKIPVIPEKYRDFAVDFTQVMEIEELLCVADICISDYSSLIFEYSLFERPMLFFAYDIEEYFDWRGFYYNYDELTPGPVFKTNREMIDYIQHIDERFNKQKVIEFRKKFMSSCDGHSTERILKAVFGDQLSSHMKQPENNNFLKNEPTLQNIREIIPRKETRPKEELLQQLFEQYPQLEGKKIIFFYMTDRPYKGYPKTRPYLDWHTLYEYLDDQYSVIYYKNGKCSTPAKHQRMRFVCGNDILTLEELISVADMAVVDFNYTVAAACLDRMPVLCYLPDYRWYCSSIQDYENSRTILVQSNTYFETTEDVTNVLNKGTTNAIESNIFLKSYEEICSHYTKEKI